MVNLAVKAALDKIHKSILSIRQLISAISMSAKIGERFKSLKVALELPEVLLPGLDVETR